MGVHSFCSVALVALLSSSCVTGAYNQTRVFQPVAVEAGDALEAGEAELGARLGIGPGAAEEAAREDARGQQEQGEATMWVI